MKHFHLPALLLSASLSLAASEDFQTLPFRLADSKLLAGQMENPEAITGIAKEEIFHLKGENARGRLVLDLGSPMEIASVQVTVPPGDFHTALCEVDVGNDWRKTRKVLGRPINLPSWKGGSKNVALPPDTVGRYLVLELSSGYVDGAVSKVEVIGRKNIPERHLIYWAGNLKEDYLGKIDYLDKDLKLTDIWLDYVETAFPQTNRNGSIDLLKESGVLNQLKERKIRFWLAEHEGFCSLVNSPQDLADETKWSTTLREAREIYQKAKEAGFYGLVLDAEDYDTVDEKTNEQYKELTDHVTGWSFVEEYGYQGAYYRRGLEFGKMLKEVWDCPLIQLYEARLYADKNDAMGGNYWWLKGIFDAGITDISIATEKSYGAGNMEMKYPNSADHLHQWFIRLPELLDDVRDQYPFVRRVIPAFHPWNTRLGTPMYLPKYFQTQLEDTSKNTTAFTLYLEGNSKGGDPREVFKEENTKPHGVSAEDYLEILREFPSRK